MTKTKEYAFLIEQSGLRLDRYLAEHCPDLTRTQGQKLITGGCVNVNGRPAKAGLKLTAGDRVNVVIPPPPPSDLISEDIPLNIVYEDNDLMVIDKPAGMTVHPAPGHPHGTLANAILSHLSYIPDAGDLRPGIVHRLDRDTSGLIIVAKNSAAHAKLAAQFKSRSVVKVYQALVKGRLTPETGAIEAPIGRDTSDRKRMAVVADGEGRAARTKYRVLKYVGNYSLLEVILETGRTHQIRVHLAAIGYAVVGDVVYGSKSPYLDRQFLHAALISFDLPSTGESVEFKSALPADLRKVLQAISMT